jgi:putative mRNA 3-end processing factor
VGFIKSDIVQITRAGLYCPAGDFFVDPTRRVDKAVITHAHSDHARPGMGEYVCSSSGEALLRTRVGAKAVIKGIPFGKEFRMGEAVVSLHPAGHILGSAQVRIACKGQTVVVSGDFNARHSHPAAEAFEPVECNLLVTESTFGLPIYHWPDPELVFGEIHAWWRENQTVGKVSVLPCYPLGKTQRILAGLDGGQGPVALTGAGRDFLPFYNEAGVNFPTVLDLNEETLPLLKGMGFLIVSAAAEPSPLMRKLGSVSYGAVSGWLQVRRMRMGRQFDRGFILSDHADWNGLLDCVMTSKAKRVAVTHGQTEVFARYLREVIGVDAFAIDGH